MLRPGILPCTCSSRLCWRSCRRRGRMGRSSHQSWQGHRRRIPLPPDSLAVLCHLPGANLPLLFWDISLREHTEGSWCPPGCACDTSSPLSSSTLTKSQIIKCFFRVHDCFLKSGWKTRVKKWKIKTFSLKIGGSACSGVSFAVAKMFPAVGMADPV